jgi:hypothetical protein
MFPVHTAASIRLHGWRLKIGCMLAVLWLLLASDVASAVRPRSGLGWAAVIVLGPPILILAELVLEAVLRGAGSLWPRDRASRRRIAGRGYVQDRHDVAAVARRRNRRRG